MKSLEDEEFERIEREQNMKSGASASRKRQISDVVEYRVGGVYLEGFYCYEELERILKMRDRMRRHLRDAMGVTTECED